MRLVLRHKIHNFWKEKIMKSVAGFSSFPCYDPVFPLNLGSPCRYELKNGVYFLQADPETYISFEVKGKKMLTTDKFAFSLFGGNLFKITQNRKRGLMFLEKEKAKR